MLGRGLALGVDDTVPMVSKRVENLSKTVDSSLSVSGGKAWNNPSAAGTERSVRYAPTFHITQQDPGVVVAAIDARNRRALAGFGGAV